ncbi:MAG: dienelactone hydrolase family protein [Dehalococcoidales bacterium]|nr:MAG: dienelactone hydrolase family protein [Dehalococcoidales bacterium]
MDNNVKHEFISVQSIPMGSGSSQVILGTPGGDIECIFNPSEKYLAAIWVSGALGGFDGPSFGIFATLSRELVTEGINSLRLNYRLPGNFDQCVLDVLVGIRFLEQRGIEKVALVGHSFGGAVAIMAGTMSNRVKAVVGLSSQTAGAQRANELSPIPLLLIHGDRDQNLPARCSQDIYNWAGEPKELVIYKGSGHFLRECKDELHDLLKTWLIDKLELATLE